MTLLKSTIVTRLRAVARDAYREAGKAALSGDSDRAGILLKSASLAEAELMAWGVAPIIDL